MSVPNPEAAPNAPLRIPIRFSWAKLDDDRFKIEVRTPVTRIGTLHRLTAAIYVLGMDVISGNVLTEESAGESVSHDNFVLRMSRPTGTVAGLYDATARLGMLMETILQENLDPVDLLREQGVEAPDPHALFTGRYEIRFTDVPERNITRLFLESQDCRGLLFHITQVLAHERINILSATILTTDTGVAEDTFYVQFEEGALGPQLCEKLRGLIAGSSQTP